MSRFAFLTIAAAVAGGWLAAAPIPADVKGLVAGLNDPSAKVRDEAAAALRGRADALPWLRRATRSTDADTARRAAALLGPHESKRQAAAAQAIDECIKSGQVDLFMERHHFWQPESEDDLWPVGPRMARVVQEECAKWCPPDQMNDFERVRNLATATEPGLKPRSYDGPLAQLPRKGRSNTSWSIRTDQWWNAPGFDHVAFASVAGPAWLTNGPEGVGRYFVLGPVQARGFTTGVFVVSDGEFHNGSCRLDVPYWEDTRFSFIVCRGNFHGRCVLGSVLLVDGDVELFEWGVDGVQSSLIRASGEIRIPKNVKTTNSTIVAHAKNPTAPYKFFELADVGLSLRDDEEGLVVADVKPKTPFGNCGLAKGDIIRAIDDAPAGHSEQFRKAVRRALVRQGDCLITVARGDKTLDLAVYFPLPK